MSAVPIKCVTYVIGKSVTHLRQPLAIAVARRSTMVCLRHGHRLLSHVIDLPMSFHLDRKTGALNETLVQGLSGYRILANHAVFTVLPVAVELLFVSAVLFNDSIASNIAFGKPDSSQAEIERAARIAHIHERIMAMPEGYRTVVGERGLKLSGGEKQRVSIARAVLKQPQLFIFDEATSSLDSKTEHAILGNLIAISKGKTTLIISHRLSTVAHADEILVLDRGRIVERGRHDDLLTRNGTYTAMWRAQHRQPMEEPLSRKASA